MKDLIWFDNLCDFCICGLLNGLSIMSGFQKVFDIEDAEELELI